MAEDEKPGFRALGLDHSLDRRGTERKATGSRKALGGEFGRDIAERPTLNQRERRKRHSG